YRVANASTLTWLRVVVRPSLTSSSRSYRPGASSTIVGLHAPGSEITAVLWAGFDTIVQVRTTSASGSSVDPSVTVLPVKTRSADAFASTNAHWGTIGSLCVPDLAATAFTESTFLTLCFFASVTSSVIPYVPWMSAVNDVFGSCALAIDA